MNKLLLIVDVQKQFIPDNLEGRKVCESIEKLQQEYTHIAVSQFINTPDSFWVKYLEWDKMMAGDDTTQLAFKPADNAFIYQSNTFTSMTPDLKSYIEKHKIEEVHLCGADTDACIISTAYDLWDEQIHFKILIDHCISSAGKNTHSVAHQIMNKNFGFKIVKAPGAE